MARERVLKRVLEEVESVLGGENRRRERFCDALRGLLRRERLVWRRGKIYIEVLGRWKRKTGCSKELEDVVFEGPRGAVWRGESVEIGQGALCYTGQPGERSGLSAIVP